MRVWLASRNSQRGRARVPQSRLSLVAAFMAVNESVETPAQAVYHPVETAH